MLDIGWSEMAVIALLALIVIGPKDLPRVMRTMGKWAHKARAVSREFQSGIDEMVREADLEDAKKALDSTRKIGLDKVIEDTVDPTGTIKQEAQDLQRSAHDAGSTKVDKPESSTEAPPSVQSAPDPASASPPTSTPTEPPRSSATADGKAGNVTDEANQKSA